MRTLPLWLESLVVTAFIFAIFCFAIYLAARALESVLESRIKLQKKRHKNEVEALNKWKKLWEDEREARRQDTAALIEEISTLSQKNTELQKQIENKNQLLSKVKVAEL